MTHYCVGNPCRICYPGLVTWVPVKPMDAAVFEAPGTPRAPDGRRQAPGPQRLHPPPVLHPRHP